MKDIAELFGVDRKTSSRWIKRGLKVVATDLSPILIMGSELKEFLKQERSKKKMPLADDEFYCFKCRLPRMAEEGSEEIIKTGKKVGREGIEQTKKIGICEKCGTDVQRLLKVCQKD